MDAQKFYKGGKNKKFRFFGPPLFIQKYELKGRIWNYFGILKLSLKIANVENMVEIFFGSKSVQQAIECVGRPYLKR